MKTLCALAVCALALSPVAQADSLPAATAAPAATKKPVTDRYDDLTVVDDYRWLENFSDPTVHAWADAQNARSRTLLDALPGRAGLARALTAIFKHRSPSYGGMGWRGGQLFAFKHDPPKQQLVLVVRPDADSKTERVVVDPTVIDPSGATAIDWYSLSHDGKRIAVSLSKNGSERGDLHLYDVATGHALADVIEHVQNGTAGGSAEFNDDGSGIYYTRYPRAGERSAADSELYQEVWLHRFGTPAASDTYQMGKGLPPIAEIALSGTRDGAYLLATVENGDGGEYEHFLRGPNHQWQQLTHFEDQVTVAAFGVGADRSLYCVSLKGSPRGSVLKLPLATPRLDHAVVIVPQGNGAIAELSATATRLWVRDVNGGPTRLRSFDLDGKDEKQVATPPVSAVSQLVALNDDDLLAEIATYLAPSAWYRVSASLPKPVITSLRRTSPVDFSHIEVTRGVAKSKDGTEVPYTILHKKGLPLDGSNPTILYGYGGFGVSESPGFGAGLSPWLDAGGVFVDANLRGGGEYGEAWHQGGMRTHKQNVFDDFVAVARQLIADKWTKPERLAAEGGSNGGLLMGAVLTQHPELWRCVVAEVGIYDMLRSEQTSNGQFNVTEYGTVKVPAERAALFAYSPYHHVTDGVKYPAVLFTTGDNDPRVDPMHSRKMTARLQAATASSQPILLRTSAKAGHGIGSSLDESINLQVDVQSFLFAELGVKPPR